MTAHRMTRQQLYDLVWSEPLRTLAKRFEISDVALAKACRRANIPLPGLGYWAKHAAGKPVIQPVLPPRGLGQSGELEFGGNRYRHHGISDEDILNTPLPSPPVFEDRLEEVAARACVMLGIRKISASLASPHPEIAKLLQDDEMRRKRQQESKWPSLFDAPRFESPLQRRRLRILNGLFLAWTRCGCVPSISAPRYGDEQYIGVRVGDQRLSFSLDVIGNSSQRYSRQKTDNPKAKLVLKISWHEPPEDIVTLWQDRDDKPLEEQMREIALGLLIAGEWTYRSSEERGYKWQVKRKQELEEKIRREHEERQRKERDYREKLEKARCDQLLSQAAAWRQASEVRAYVKAFIESRSAGNAGDTQAVEVWAQWALAEADRIDPLLQTGPGASPVL